MKMKMKNKKLTITILLLFSVIVSAYAQPSITLDQNADSYCHGDSVYFTNSTSGDYEASHWKFGDELDTWKTNPVHIYQQSGTYTVWLIIILSGGTKDSTSVDITINPAPIITLNNDVDLQRLTANTGVADAQFIWYFGVIQTAETDSIIYYLESGLYSVVASYESCSDSASINIVLNDTTENIQEIIVENNILTPDIADGANDVLFIKDLSFYTATVSVLVYNKWGQLVYTNSTYTNLGGFSGEGSNGKRLDAGTYYYIINSPNRKTTTGYIDIIR